MFKKGQKVVCVDAYHKSLQKHKVYTVQRSEFCCIWWVSLEEIGRSHGGGDPCYCGKMSEHTHDEFEADAFRPVITDWTTDLIANLYPIIQEGPGVIVPQETSLRGMANAFILRASMIGRESVMN